MSNLSRKPHWQRERALLLHARFAALELAVANGARIDDQVDALSRELQGHELILTGGDGEILEARELKASKPTLYRALKRWRDGGRTPSALGFDYRSGGASLPMPEDLKSHIRMLCSESTGGRNKHGLAPATYARDQIHKAWKAGESVPGLGTWQEWWAAYRSGHQMPDTAPEFPWSDKTIRNHAGNKALREAGNRGLAAARNKFPRMELDYSQLRKAELFTLDDVRLDVAAINEFTGQVVTVTAYIMMEVGSRRIVSYIVRDGSAIKSRDVDALISAGLEVTGIGVGYTTKILFERGTVACSDELKAILEGGTGNRIQVRRTGMVEGINWIGAAADQKKGNAAGKAVIESFNRWLHHRLLGLPGQRGNTADNSPANLGIEKRDQINGGFDKKRGKARKPLSERSLVERTELLSRFKRQAAIHGIDCDLEFPMLTVAQLDAEVHRAIEAHNTEPGHGYQGHHQRVQIEVSPGVYQDLSPS